MANETVGLTRHDLEAKIVKHSWEDEAFRKEFIADPAGAFVKYLNIPAASLPKIAVHQEQPGTWHIVIPAKPAEMNELSEQDLERVAAGNNLIQGLVAVLSVPIAIAVSGGSVTSAVVSTKESHGW
jgi:hypothetical protein